MYRRSTCWVPTPVTSRQHLKPRLRWPTPQASGLLTTRWRPILDRVVKIDVPRMRTVVVVPHPDDETLSTAAILHQQAARGQEIVVVAVTDGEAAYPVQGLAERRRREQVRALAELGVPVTALRRLGLPDGDVASHHAQVVDEISALIDQDTLLVAPWTGDHHCDHEACGRAAAEAADSVSAKLLFGLFWAWHHCAPADLALEPLVGVALSEAARACRTRAIRAHATQLTTAVAPDPVLTAGELETLDWPAEYFVDPNREFQ